MKTEHLCKCEFVSVDFRDVASVKMSYKKLMRACVPGVLSNLPEHSFNKLVDESGWLVQVSYSCLIYSLSTIGIDLHFGVKSLKFHITWLANPKQLFLFQVFHMIIVGVI